MIKALGVTYTLRVVEEKVFEHGYSYEERCEEREESWVESVNFPVAEHGGEDVLQGGSEEEAMEVDDGEVQIVQCQEHGDSILHDGDVSRALGGKGQKSPFLSDGMLDDQLGKLVEKDTNGGDTGVNEAASGGSQGKKLSVGYGEVDKGGEVNLVMETCPLKVGADFRCGPSQVKEALNELLTRPLAFEPDFKEKPTRSGSLPPNRSCGSASKVGRFANNGLDFNDSISLIEVRRGVDSDRCKGTSTLQTIETNGAARRGRPRKVREKSKQPTINKVGMPKFMKLGEALKEGGGKQRKKKNGDRSREGDGGGRWYNDKFLRQGDPEPRGYC
jgi:hypothetical protein